MVAQDATAVAHPSWQAAPPSSPSTPQELAPAEESTGMPAPVAVAPAGGGAGQMLPGAPTAAGEAAADGRGQAAP